MAQQIQLRNGTAAAWTSANPTLASGEAGVETDTLKFKLGNGSTAWNSLSYAAGLFAGGTLTSALNAAPAVTLASAATVNIGAAAGNTINVSGTTTITAFDTIAAGAQRRLIFAGILTLTHNATSLILPTGANITTAAGDIADVESLGAGNWKCVDYVRASPAPVAMTTAIDFSQDENLLTLTSAPTLTVAATPATGRSTTIKVIGDTVARVVTLPAGTWRSAQQQATITTFSVPANWQGYITLEKTAAGYDVIGEPVALSELSWNRTQTTGANETKTLTARASRAGTITRVSAKTASGTISVQVRINGTNVTTGVASATSTRSSVVPTAANTFVAGDVIDLVYSSNSSAVSTDVTVDYLPTAA